MTGHFIFALLGLAGYVSAMVLGVMGWLVPVPDGSYRFSLRLWAWLCMTGGTFCSFGLVHHPRWWQWVIYGAAFAFQINRIERWWKAAEAARRLERAQPWRVQR